MKSKLSSKAKRAVEEYQCPGCVCGSDAECYKSGGPSFGVACTAHTLGTRIVPHVGLVFLGMPKGFNRVGRLGHDQTLSIFENTEQFMDYWSMDKFNIPAWKMLMNGHTFIRGLSPRVNSPFLIVILEDCRGDIDCLEITDKDIDEID